MSSKIQIVTPKDNTPGVRAFVKAAQAIGVQLDVLVLGDSEIVNKLNTDLPAIYRFGPKSYDTLQQLHVLLSNQLQKTLLKNNLQAFDKCLSYKVLADRGVPQPLSEVRTHRGAVPKLPVVIKPPIGNQGSGVELVKSPEEFIDFETQYLNTFGMLLVQTYIPESKGSDKRLIIAGDSCVAAMQRSAAEGDFRANLHQGGTAKPYVPTPQEVALAVQACHTLGLLFAGVDIIDSNKGSLVLEVNPSPGFGISDVVGIDVARAVLKKIYNV